MIAITITRSGERKNAIESNGDNIHNGICLCQQLRSQGYRVPILMLTATDTNTDKVMGLDDRADDYVVKPFSLTELLAWHRQLSIVTLLPITLIALTGTSIPIVEKLGFGDAANLMIKVHTGKTLGLDLFYSVATGLGLLSLIVTGVFLTGRSDFDKISKPVRFLIVPIEVEAGNLHH